jgi:hypothetical protein
MNLNTLPIIAVLPYAAIALGLGTTLLLFFSLKVEFHRASRKERRRIDEVLARLEEARTAEPLAEVSPSIATPPSGINLNRRVQALRLLSKGEDVGHIAAVLGVPRQEVELLVRVQNYVAERQAAGAAAGR